jgi:hypothetical protein
MPGIELDFSNLSVDTASSLSSHHFGIDQRAVVPGSELANVAAMARPDNAIDLMAIMNGSCTKTSVMLKNVPNRYTQVNQITVMIS